MGSTSSFRTLAAVVLVYAVAMAYLESAIVVYLTGALGGQVGVLFPLRPVAEAGSLVAIEMGREVATLVMIGAVGVLAGRSRLERLAWAAAVFGAWDIAYYGWLWVFAGWPGSPDATDLLFLLPAPWVGPVWSPVAVSVALVAVGLAAAHRLRAGGTLVVDARHWAAGIAGGLLVIVSYTLQASVVLDGGQPGPYAWPVFAAGMLLAIGAAVHAFRAGSRARHPRSPQPSASHPRSRRE